MRARQDGTYCGMMHRVGRLLRTQRHWQSLLLAGVLVCLLPVMGCSDSGDAGEAGQKAGEVLHDPLSGMEFVWIPKGCFTMGWISGRIGAEFERPAHNVCFDEGFWMGRYEVTQEQWQRVMGDNPSCFNEERIGPKARYHPVEMVSWYDVQQFLQTLNEWAGIDKYHLPSEAQWEYAARAGTETLYFFGDDLELLHEYAWYGEYSKHDGTHHIGQLKPNDWGLYDMYGNVAEWCADLWHENYVGAPSDGSVWESDAESSDRVQRGGSWNEFSFLCESTVRYFGIADDRDNISGFRVVIPLDRAQHHSLRHTE